MARQLTDSERLDRDLAILVLTAPLWALTFLGLFVAGAIADAYRARHQSVR